MVSTEFPVTDPDGLSVVEDRLYRHLVGHAAEEASLISEYRRLAEDPATPDAARYLMRMLVDDEERHHRMFRDIAVALGNGIAWRRDPDAVPSLPIGAPSPVLAEVTERFLAAERADKKQLRALQRQLRAFRDTTMWTLLVEIMERDTDKHIRLLQFLHDNIAAGSKHLSR